MQGRYQPIKALPSPRVISLSQFPLKFSTLLLLMLFVRVSLLHSSQTLSCPLLTEGALKICVTFENIKQVPEKKQKFCNESQERQLFDIIMILNDDW